MDSTLIHQFQKLIAAHLGIHVREQERVLLEKTLAARLQASRLPGVENYYELLSRGDSKSEAEWKQLAILLTNQESYFFRDQGQFALLRHRILPELIERNTRNRTLRIWSAGCSTGQEPYSLAILVDLLLPLRTDWSVSIIGTDVSEAALEKARRGVYSSWSFRMMEPRLQQQYFHRRQNEWELDEKIRKFVTFRHGNLSQDGFPSQATGLYDIDLILCRNVFIYFQRDVVGRVLKKFSQTLREDGYLLTGHAELHDAPLGDLRPRVFPETVIFQKSSAVHTKPLTPPTLVNASHVSTPSISLRSTPATSTVTSAATASRDPAKQVQQNRPAIALEDGAIHEIITLLKSGNNTLAIKKLQPFLEAGGPFEALCLAAQAHANAGRYDEAEEYCRRASSLQPFQPLPLHILARIAEEQGDREAAKVLLKKVSYLAPKLIVPHLELSAIYEFEGDKDRADKLRRTVRELLDGLSPDENVPTDPLCADKKIAVGALKRLLEEKVG